MLLAQICFLFPLLLSHTFTLHLFLTGRNPVLFSGLESGHHLVEISPLGCSGGSKTLSVKFSV